MLGAKDDELATRWLQFGVFSPITRLHSTMSEWMSKEPWNYRKECEDIMKNFLRFRHKMIPYLYTMNVRSAKEDEPLIQPLYWEYPKERDAQHNRNQYFLRLRVDGCADHKAKTSANWYGQCESVVTVKQTIR